MPTYAILVLPSANRVYGRDAPRLVRSELGVVNETVLGGRLESIEERTLGGVPYVTFFADRLEAPDVAWLSNLSAAYALFELDRDVLRPLELSRRDGLDDDLLTIQRYSGKTNEQFTKLLVNVTLACSRRGRELTSRKLRLIDPLAGRGTTLNQALVYGFDVAGIEVERTAFDAYGAFLKTWLRNKRFKHRVEEGTVRREGRVVARRFDIVFAPTKQDFAAGRTLEVRYVNDDTRHALDHFRQESFDVLVADLPYGVQHAGRRGGTRSSPRELAAEALPEWAKLLGHGGGLGLACNVRVLPREELAALVEAAGLRVCAAPSLAGLSHRVDRAIERDVVVAERP